MTNDNLLHQGINLAKSGNFQQASFVLAQVVKDDPFSEQGWLWLGHCRTVPREKKYCFGKVISINPNNIEARQELQKLEIPITSSHISQSPVEKPPASVSDVPHPTTTVQQPEPIKEETQIPARKNWVRRLIYLLVGIMVGIYLGRYIGNTLSALGFFDKLDVAIALRTINIPEFQGSPQTPVEQIEPTPTLSLADPYEIRLEQAWPLIGQAKAHMAARQYNNAIPVLNQVLEIVPEYADAHYLIGISYFQIKGSQRAKSEYDYYLNLSIEAFDKAINLDPGVGDYYAMRGRAYASSGFQQYLRTDFQQLERIAVENFTYGAQLPLKEPWSDKDIVIYEAMLNAGDCEGVVPALEELLKSETEPSPRLHSLLSDAYYCIGDLDNALMHKDEAYKLSPSSICLCDRALILYGLGKTDEAMSDIEKSLSNSPYYSGHRYYIRALFYAERGDTEQAQKDLDFGITQTWARGGLLSYVQGKIALTQGKKEDAIYYFQEAEATYMNEGPMLEQIRKDLIDLGGVLQESQPFPFSVTPLPSTPRP